MATGLLFLLLCQYLKAQTNTLNNPRLAPLLKQVALGNPNLLITSRKEAHKYVNMAVLDKKQERLTLFTCYGNAYDSVQLSDIDYKHIASGALDPFAFYKRHCRENVSYLDDALSHYREAGKDALNDTTYNRRQVYNAAPVRSAFSSLQKMMAMENLLKRQYLLLVLSDSERPSFSPLSDTFLLNKSLAGKMICKGDTTTYYNAYLPGPVSKILLCRHTPGKMFVYNKQGQLTDSVPLKPEKYASLLKAKEDVFMLYRGWLELQSQQLREAWKEADGLLNRQHTGLYAKTYQPEDKRQSWLALQQLESLRLGVEVKISNLLLPDHQTVKNMLRETYADTPTEISYLAGLGFAYTTTYLRGKKQYELSDNRNNVMTVVSDKKKGVDQSGNGVIAYYNADVISAYDYYPGGLQLPGRSYGMVGRYGFGGKERLSEHNNDNYDFGARIYDARIGKWLSVDPLQKKYPGWSPYNYAAGNPVYFNDVDGRDVGVTIDKVNGTITFSNTIYLMGPTLRTATQLQQDFDKNVKAKMSGFYKDENGRVWTVQTSLTFKKATAEDIQRVSRSAVPIAESLAITNKNLDSRFSIGKVGENVMDMAYGMTGDASLFTHENVHNWGLADKYFAGVVVDNKGFAMRDKKGDLVEFLYTRPGYEGDILGGYYKEGADGKFVPEQAVSLTEKTINTVASAAFKQSKALGDATNFVMEGAIENPGYSPRKSVPYDKAPEDVKKTLDPPKNDQ